MDELMPSQTLCKHCQTALTGQFCHYCGQEVKPPVSPKTFMAETFVQLTDLDRGLLHTIIKLFKAPDQVIKDYLNGNTVAYYHPVKFMVLLVGLEALIINRVWSVQPIIASDTGQAKTTKLVQEALDLFFANFDLVMMASSPALAIFLTWFFGRTQFNFAISLIVVSYISGLNSLMMLPIQPIIGYIAGQENFWVSMVFSQMLFLVWLAWASKSVIAIGKLKRILFMLIAYAMNQIVIALLVAVFITLYISIKY